MEASSEMTPREQYTFLARLAEHAERFDEMAANMREVALVAKELTIEERNLLSVAYKNVIGARRASLRLVITLYAELREKSAAGDAAAAHHAEVVAPVKAKIEEELREISNTVLSLLKDPLISNASDVEVKVFYYKMAGDYNRYLAEFEEGKKKKSSASAAYDSYVEALELAKDSLSPTHPLRLGLALNFSVFYYEVLNSANRACVLAKQAFDDAIPELDTLPDELYHDSKLIMKLLRDNLTFWQNEAAAESQQQQQQLPAEPTASGAAADATAAAATSGAGSETIDAAASGAAAVPAASAEASRPEASQASE